MLKKYILASTVMVVMVGCSSSSEENGSRALTQESTTQSVEDSKVLDDQDFLAIASVMQGRHLAVDPSRWFNSLSEVYPSDAGNAGITESVIVGNVVGVEQGRAFISKSNPEEGEADSSEVEWGSPDAMWRTVHLRVKVKSVIDGSPPKTEEIQVGLAVSGGDIQSTIKGLKKLNRVGVFLRHTPVFGYDQNVYSIVGDGAFLLVPTGGRYKLPFLPDREAGVFHDEARMTSAISVP